MPPKRDQQVANPTPTQVPANAKFPEATMADNRDDEDFAMEPLGRELTAAEKEELPKQKDLESTPDLAANYGDMIEKLLVTLADIQKMVTYLKQIGNAKKTAEEQNSTIEPTSDPTQMDLTKNEGAVQPHHEESSSAGTEPPFKTISYNLLQLINPIPPDTPSDRKCWTTKQEKEVLKREKEQDQINEMEAKVKNAIHDRQVEVESMNRRREKYSTDLANEARRKSQANEIKVRQAEKTRRKKEAIAKIQTEQYPH
ncbi:Protein CBG23661 [Caenorhabditis briggsae]|uniref:Protein CBG23661 n=1 Tax=Caenorhabditis briggsae TaxID=6238 RepID=A8WJ15_CAEBR|nr:Protein CBG23661 [Caenorhabditis briggsae]CAP20459.2 Protein CBG23661 [Caenorhabditis briggsae]